MKKVALVLISIFTLTAFMISGCEKKDKLTKVRVNEVAHSIFYAPQYVALEKNYFKEEGLDVTITTGFGADKTMTAVLSDEADIGFMGSESSIYVYNEGLKDYVVNFSQLTQRAGNFLVARNEDKDFKWEKVKGKTVIGGRKGGMPQMILEYILKKNNIDPKKDLTIIQNIDFGMTAEAFTSNKADYTVEFEPAATNLEKGKKGNVVASLGTSSGMVPYTAYSAKKSYIDNNKDTIQKFTNAIQKGLTYVNTHTPEETAKIIKKQFPETDEKDIVTIVKRYYDQQTWKDNSVFDEDSFNLLQDILKEADQLDKEVPYKELVTTEFAKKAK